MSESTGVARRRDANAPQPNGTNGRRNHNGKPSPSVQPRSKALGPVRDLEQHVHRTWWRDIFNANYLKTDADVVDDQRITRQEIDLFAELLHLTDDDRVLDLCCGQGRHSLELARRGFRCEGLDRSRYLIERARKQSDREQLGVKFREGDARKVPYQPDSFDAVMILGNSFGYFDSVQDDLRVLREVFRVLKPGGRLLIDASDGDWLRANFQPRSWEWIDRQMFVCRERQLSADKQRLISREVITHTEKGVVADQFYAERLYNRETLSELLGEAGFRDVAFHGTITPESERNQDLGMMQRRHLVTATLRKEWTVVKKRPRPDVCGVTVLMGDPSKLDRVKPDAVFDDDDFATIDELKSALHDISGFRFAYLNNHDTLIGDLAKQKGKIDLVLNLCDEGYDNDARKELHVPALLDALGIPYTGAGPQCLAFCYDKSLVRGVAREMGVPVPQAWFVNPEDSAFELPMSFPVIIKPNVGDSSFGITQNSVVERPEDLVDRIAKVREQFGYERPILIEEYLTGADLTVGIIGNPPNTYTVLPIVEEDYSALPPGLPHICGYEAKWDPQSPYWKLKSVPAKLSEETERSLVDWSVRLFQRLECADYARLDWRLDSNGTPRLLEVNPNPGWCWDGHLAKMSKLAGISYSEMLEAILHAAEQRLRIARPS